MAFLAEPIVKTLALELIPEELPTPEKQTVVPTQEGYFGSGETPPVSAAPVIVPRPVSLAPVTKGIRADEVSGPAGKAMLQATDLAFIHEAAEFSPV